MSVPGFVIVFIIFFLKSKTVKPVKAVPQRKDKGLDLLPVCSLSLLHDLINRTCSTLYGSVFLLQVGLCSLVAAMAPLLSMTGGGILKYER